MRCSGFGEVPKAEEHMLQCRKLIRLMGGLVEQFRHQIVFNFALVQFQRFANGFLHLTPLQAWGVELALAHRSGQPREGFAAPEKV
nr:hypothetical protein [Verrucomicrobium sp. BvORR106]